MRRLKIKIVGDGNVGKTCFLIRWYNENFPPSPSERRPAFPENCVPPVQDPYYTSITVDRTSYVLTYWDTLIAPEFHKFRRMEYQETDVFLACFDIANPSSFQNVSTVWVPELKHFMPETPILVVGNKKDLRSTAALSEGMVSVSKGEELAQRLGTSYCENSAKSGDGLREVLVAAVRLATQSNQPNVRGKYRVFQRPKRKSSKALRSGPDPPLLSPPGSVPEIAIESSTFTDDWHGMIEARRCCDVKFVFSDNSGPVYAHKMVLCMGSSMFRDYFLNGGESSSLSGLLVKEHVTTSPEKNLEEQNQTLNISKEEVLATGCSSTGSILCKPKNSVVHFNRTVCGKSFANVLAFLYTGQPGVSKNSKEALFAGTIGLARRLELQWLVESCENILSGEHFLNPSITSIVTAIKGKKAKQMFLNKPDLSDVTFYVENSRVHAHKALLMSRSEVMSAMLGGSFSESESNEVNIHGAALSSFLALLEYLYSDRLPKDATISEYKEVLILADRFCLPRLISVCEQAISQLITAGLKRKPLSQAVCVEIINLLLISQAHNASQLAKWCLYMITTNYTEFESCEDFDLIRGDNRRHIIEHRWPPLSYLKELEEFKRKTGRV